MNIAYLLRTGSSLGALNNFRGVYGFSICVSTESVVDGRDPFVVSGYENPIKGVSVFDTEEEAREAVIQNYLISRGANVYLFTEDWE